MFPLPLSTAQGRGTRLRLVSRKKFRISIPQAQKYIVRFGTFLLFDKGMFQRAYSYLPGHTGEKRSSRHGALCFRSGWEKKSSIESGWTNSQPEKARILVAEPTTNQGTSFSIWLWRKLRGKRSVRKGLFQMKRLIRLRKVNRYRAHRRCKV